MNAIQSQKKGDSEESLIAHLQYLKLPHIQEHFKSIAQQAANRQWFAELYRHIGQLKVERDFLAKRPGI